MNHCRTILALAALCAAPVAANGAQVSTLRVTELVDAAQGEIVELKVSGSDLARVTGRLGTETVYFYPAQNGDYEALVGVDLEAKPGLTKVFVRGETTSGKVGERQIALKIKRKAFRKESFTVAPKFDKFTPEVLERIAFEREKIARVYTGGEARRLWDGAFAAPVPKQVTSPFGYRRIINGTPRSPHTGVDLKAALGSEVSAPNHGRVALLGDFFFSGKSVVLDHGAGLFTMYFHLSEFRVEEGAEVRKGEIVGLAGMSGRVTGPHLHWAARLNGARVDPFELVEKLGGNAKGTVRSEARLDKKENGDGKEGPGE